MQKNLVIVESPAKAKTIEKFLGEDFRVMSSYGHIRDLEKKDFGVDLNTFQPKYEIPKEKAAVVKELRAAAKKAETIWLASDEDREGEAISWHLAEVLKLDPKSARRIVFHEITQPAILHAIEHPRTIDLNLVDAQQARRVLDRLVGFRLSPVLWRKVRPNLSAGRVQSVTVRLVVEREREIQAFQSQSSYRVVAQFTLPTSTAKNNSFKAELNHRFNTQAEAEAFLQHCQKAEFKISTIATKPSKRTPAPPFTTSTLQQEAARKLGFPVATTMRVAQSLYESGRITYMRTDSMNLSQLCLNTAAAAIEQTMGKEYHKRRNYTTKAKGAQEAHEAIRPTYIDQQKIEGTSQEKRLYDLIWKRTIASQMADAQLERTTVTIEVAGSPYNFVATGEVIKFDGFLRVYSVSQEEESNESDESSLLPPMQEGQQLQRQVITAQERFSQPPARYSEASLVSKLEELGIGRPSTYAPTISTIQQREYVRKGESEGQARHYQFLTLEGDSLTSEQRSERTGSDKGKLVPTDTGIVVNDFLVQSFPEIMDYHFTAKVEQDFDHVAEGDKQWTQLISTFYHDLNPLVESVMNERSESRVGERQLGNDPTTGKAVSVKIGRFGPMAQLGSSEDEEAPRFAKLQPTQSITTITLEEALDLFKLPRSLGEFEGKEVKVGAGRFGPYVQHSGKYVSIPKEDDPMNIELPRAIELIEEKRAKEAASHLASFEEEPELEVRAGRWGPYIIYKGANYKIPKTQHDTAAQLTLSECMAIVKTEGEKPARGKSAAAKKADSATSTTKKTNSKKASPAKKKTTASKTSKT